MSGSKQIIDQKAISKAEVLIEALPYIQRFSGMVTVVKYGGAAMKDKELERHVIEDVALLKLIGFRPVIVHGGGKKISEWVDRAGITPRFYKGLRVTDAQTLELAQMVLGKVNADLVMMTEKLGVKAAGISGIDGGLLTVRKKMPDGEDIGYVGDVTSVDTTILKSLIDSDFIPIVYPIGHDEEGQFYNINADHAAAAVAKAIHAEKLVYLTDTSGVYEDPDDPSSVISELYVDEAKELIANGSIQGGMIPKVQNCIDVIESGVRRVHILNGSHPHSLLLEIFTDRGVGTAIMRNDESRYLKTAQENGHD